MRPGTTSFIYGMTGSEVLLQMPAPSWCYITCTNYWDEDASLPKCHKLSLWKNSGEKFPCAGLDDLGPFSASIELRRHKMGTGEHNLTNAMGISLLKNKLNE